MHWKRLGVAGVAVLGAAAGTGGTFGGGELVAFDPQTVTVGESDGQAVVTVARSACERGDFRLHFEAPTTSTNQSSAEEDVDYEPVLTSRQWWRCSGESGRREQVFTVPILDDTEVEEDENVEMRIYASPASTNQTTPMPAVDPDGEIVIRDDDGDPGVQLVARDVRVPEAAGVAKVTVERRRGDEPDTGAPMSLSWATADGSAKAGADYTGEAAGALEIPAGESRATVTVPVEADSVVEGEEDLSVRFTWGDREAVAKLTIIDTTKRAAAKQADVIAVPSAALAQSSKGPCLSKRRFTIRLRGLRRGTVTLDGKPLKTRRRGGSLTAQVDLQGRLKGRYALKVNGRTTRGKAVNQTRTYRTCSPKRRG